ncbi:MAG: c-type cytochrome [Steroidobacteraceae bacterium]
MIAHTRRAAFSGMAAICAAFLLIRTAGAAEVESDSIDGRTEAAVADFRSAMKLEPNLQHGAELFTSCAACHAANGLGTRDGSVPAIAGQHVSVLVKQLVDFRHDRRWNERMQNFASRHHLSGPQELLDVAAYAESLPRWPPLAGGTGDGSMLKHGNVVYHRYCAECHGPLGLGELRRMRPRLAGQRYQYLLRQLEETANRMRPGMDVEHVKLIGALSAEERRAVADYLSRLSPDLASTQDRTPEPP